LFSHYVTSCYCYTCHYTASVPIVIDIQKWRRIGEVSGVGRSSAKWSKMLSVVIVFAECLCVADSFVDDSIKA